MMPMRVNGLAAEFCLSRQIELSDRSPAIAENRTDCPLADRTDEPGHQTDRKSGDEQIQKPVAPAKLTVPGNRNVPPARSNDAVPAVLLSG
jgi:hypothetical protein